MPATVVVTGFGPFGKHKINASYETAKALESFDFSTFDINLVIEEIPVIYDTVVSTIPFLWENYKPTLMVHLGVSHLATEITLESLAYKDGYMKKDVKGLLPEQGTCCIGQEECIFPCLDIQKVCLEINSSTDIEVSSCVSQDAGRYLCEFTFYASLCIDRSRVVFIHVPELDKPYTAKQMAAGIRKIILLLMEQIRSTEQA